MYSLDPKGKNCNSRRNKALYGWNIAWKGGIDYWSFVRHWGSQCSSAGRSRSKGALADRHAELEDIAAAIVDATTQRPYVDVYEILIRLNDQGR